MSDRIKTVLLTDKGKSHAQIAEFLLIDEDTSRRHLKAYQDDGVLSIKSGGSKGLLIGIDALTFLAVLADEQVPTAAHAVDMAERLHGVTFTVSGMVTWLKKHGFSWKKSVGVPAKADATAQTKFIEAYQELKATLPEGDEVLFLDAAHPTMATKMGYGWSLKGERKVVKTTAGRTRVNVLGSLNPATMDLVTCFPETVNSESIEQHFAQLRKVYPIDQHATLHIVLDCGSYNTSRATEEAASRHDIKLHHLPPYSPNLNIIERVWKLMNETARDNVYFPTAASFKKAIDEFFSQTWNRLKASCAARFTDNFEVLKPAF